MHTNKTPSYDGHKTINRCKLHTSHEGDVGLHYAVHVQLYSHHYVVRMLPIQTKKETPAFTQALMMESLVLMLVASSSVAEATQTQKSDERRSFSPSHEGSSFHSDTLDAK